MPKQTTVVIENAKDIEKLEIVDNFSATRLELKNFELGKEDAKFIADYIRTNEYLVEFSIDCPVPYSCPDSIPNLAQGIADSKSLTDFYLFKNSLPNHVEPLVAALPKHDKPIRLYLVSDSMFGGVCCPAIMGDYLPSIRNFFSIVGTQFANLKRILEQCTRVAGHAVKFLVLDELLINDSEIESFKILCEDEKLDVEFHSFRLDIHSLSEVVSAPGLVVLLRNLWKKHPLTEFTLELEPPDNEDNTYKSILSYWNDLYRELDNEEMRLFKLLCFSYLPHFYLPYLKYAAIKDYVNSEFNVRRFKLYSDIPIDLLSEVLHKKAQLEEFSLRRDVDSKLRASYERVYITTLTYGLNRNLHLKRLELRDCINDENVKKFGGVIKRLEALKVFNISSEINDGWMLSVVQFLRENRNIKHVDLRGNCRMSVAVLSAFDDFLTTNTTLLTCELPEIAGEEAQKLQDQIRHKCEQNRTLIDSRPIYDQIQTAIPTMPDDICSLVAAYRGEKTEKPRNLLFEAKQRFNQNPKKAILELPQIIQAVLEMTDGRNIAVTVARIKSLIKEYQEKIQNMKLSPKYQDKLKAVWEDLSKKESNLRWFDQYSHCEDKPFQQEFNHAVVTVLRKNRVTFNVVHGQVRFFSLSNQSNISLESKEEVFSVRDSRKTKWDAMNATEESSQGAPKKFRVG